MEWRRAYGFLSQNVLFKSWFTVILTRWWLTYSCAERSPSLRVKRRRFWSKQSDTTDLSSQTWSADLKDKSKGGEFHVCVTDDSSPGAVEIRFMCGAFLSIWSFLCLKCAPGMRGRRHTRVEGRVSLSKVNYNIPLEYLQWRKKLSFNPLQTRSGRKSHPSCVKMKLCKTRIQKSECSPFSDEKKWPFESECVWNHR